jgi:hypothetical protein
MVGARKWTEFYEVEHLSNATEAYLVYGTIRQRYTNSERLGSCFSLKPRGNRPEGGCVPFQAIYRMEVLLFVWNAYRRKFVTFIYTHSYSHSHTAVSASGSAVRIPRPVSRYWAVAWRQLQRAVQRYGYSAPCRAAGQWRCKAVALWRREGLKASARRWWTAVPLIQRFRWVCAMCLN